MDIAAGVYPLEGFVYTSIYCIYAAYRIYRIYAAAYILHSWRQFTTGSARLENGFSTYYCPRSPTSDTTVLLNKNTFLNLYKIILANKIWKLIKLSQIFSNFINYYHYILKHSQNFTKMFLSFKLSKIAFNFLKYFRASFCAFSNNSFH